MSAIKLGGGRLGEVAFGRACSIFTWTNDPSQIHFSFFVGRAPGGQPLPLPVPQRRRSMPAQLRGMRLIQYSSRHHSPSCFTNGARVNIALTVNSDFS
jgi:hypothetical protein